MQPILFLFPSYQPTVLFCELLEQLRQIDPSPFVVVDYGRGPAYSELFQRAGQVSDTVVLKNAINLGKGAALKHGINYILVNHPDCIGIVTADADGQHAAEDILKVANELRSRPTEPFSVRATSSKMFRSAARSATSSRAMFTVS